MAKYLVTARTAVGLKTYYNALPSRDYNEFQHIAGMDLMLASRWSEVHGPRGLCETVVREGVLLIDYQCAVRHGDYCSALLEDLKKVAPKRKLAIFPKDEVDVDRRGQRSGHDVRLNFPMLMSICLATNTLSGGEGEQRGCESRRAFDLIDGLLEERRAEAVSLARRNPGRRQIL